MCTDRECFRSPIWLPALHGLASAFLLFVHRSLFWNINVLVSVYFFKVIVFLVVWRPIVDNICWKPIHDNSLLLPVTVQPVFHNPKCKSGNLCCCQRTFIGMLNLCLCLLLPQNIRLPLSFALMIICNNLCLYYMDLPMYFVARSLAVPFSLVRLNLSWLHESAALLINYARTPCAPIM